jgi:hypothetical protein
MDFLKFRRGVGRATDAQTDSQEMQEHIVINHADEESGGMLGGSKSNRPIQSQKKTQNPPTEGFLAKLQRIRLLIWQQWMLFYETKMVIFPQFALDEPTKDGNKYKFHEPTVKKVTFSIYVMMLSVSIGLFVYYMTLQSSSVTQFSQISQKYLTGQDATPIPDDQQPSNTKSYTSTPFQCTNLLPLPFPTQLFRFPLNASGSQEIAKSPNITQQYASPGIFFPYSQPALAVSTPSPYSFYVMNTSYMSSLYDALGIKTALTSASYVCSQIQSTVPKSSLTTLEEDLWTAWSAASRPLNGDNLPSSRKLLDVGSVSAKPAISSCQLSPSSAMCQLTIPGPGTFNLVIESPGFLTSSAELTISSAALSTDVVVPIPPSIPASQTLFFDILDFWRKIECADLNSIRMHSEQREPAIILFLWLNHSQYDNAGPRPVSGSNSESSPSRCILFVAVHICSIGHAANHFQLWR